MPPVLLELMLVLILLGGVLALMMAALRSYYKSAAEAHVVINPTPREYQIADVIAEVEDIELRGYLEETASIAIIPPLTSNHQITFGA